MINELDLPSIMNAWLEAALAEWRRNVRDDQKGVPGDRDIITEYFEAVGWGWHVPGGYVERDDNPWCGIGLAAAGLRLGDYLDPGQCVGVMLDREVANKAMPSTNRINNPEKWPGGRLSGFWDWREDDQSELVMRIEEYPQIATIAAREYGDYRDDIGGHFVMPYEVDGDFALTVEFNGVGEVGDGSKNTEGVVKARRHLDDFRRLYFMRPEHFDVMGRP